MTARSNRKSRRGSLLAEVTMAAVLLMVAMTLTVKVMGYAGIERRATERRQCGLLEVANLMEKITAERFDLVTARYAERITLSDETRRLLPDPRTWRRYRRNRTRARPKSQADRDQSQVAWP